jgi:hypothetical protein
MTTLDTLYESLAQCPNERPDWQARSILGDWYEEAGQQHAADCIRWMIRQKKRPYRSTTGTYHWFNAERGTTNPPQDPESDIPEAVYSKMQGREGLEKVFRDYDTLRAADEDFHAGWHKAREQGWTDDA